MKYLALLRGVNVGGKGTIKMTELKAAFEKAGYKNVVTFINSGNIVFDADETGNEALTKKIDVLLEKTFFAIDTVVLSKDEVQIVIDQIPSNWHHEDLRKYIAFIKSPARPEDVIRVVQLKAGIDTIKPGTSVVYMSTKMEGLTKSGFPKLSAKPIYKSLTIRNYNTVP